MNRFTITAHTNDLPRINYERRGLTQSESQRLANILTEAFHSVEILCEDTGEVCLTRYYSCNFFVPNHHPGTAIVFAEEELERMRLHEIDPDPETMKRVQKMQKKLDDIKK